MITPEQLASSGTEHGHQCAVFCWANQNLDKYPQLKYMYAIPNGFFGSAAQKGKMKAEGLKNGVPDICLPVTKHVIYPITYNPPLEEINNQKLIATSFGWAKTFAGLYIELKVGKNQPSKEQEDWIAFLLSQGYACHVVWGWEEVRDRIVEYLEGT